MVSGLPASPFAAAPQGSLSNLGWGIEWSSAEGRWVAAAQPGAKPQTAEVPSGLRPQPQPQGGQNETLPKTASVPEDSLAQLERTGSVGELSAASEAGHPQHGIDTGALPAQNLAVQSDRPVKGELSRQYRTVSEAAALPDEAAPSRAAAGATEQPGQPSAAALSGCLRKNCSSLQSGAGPDFGLAQVQYHLHKNESPNSNINLLWPCIVLSRCTVAMPKK